MFSQIENFLELWEQIPRSHQFPLCFHYLYFRTKEELAYKAFLRRPIQEIERMLDVFVEKVEMRKLLISGCLGISWEKGNTLKIFHIYIREGGRFQYRLETFVHEILHVFVRTYGLCAPDEVRLDSIAIKVAKQNRKKLESILVREIYIQPDLLWVRLFFMLQLFHDWIFRHNCPCRYLFYY